MDKFEVFGKFSSYERYAGKEYGELAMKEKKEKKDSRSKWDSNYIIKTLKVHEDMHPFIMMAKPGDVLNVKGYIQFSQTGTRLIVTKVFYRRGDSKWNAYTAGMDFDFAAWREDLNNLNRFIEEVSNA